MEVVVACIESCVAPPASICFFGYGLTFLCGSCGFPLCGTCFSGGLFPSYAGVFVLTELDDEARRAVGVPDAAPYVVALEGWRHRKEHDRNSGCYADSLAAHVLKATSLAPRETPEGSATRVRHGEAPL